MPFLDRQEYKSTCHEKSQGYEAVCIGKSHQEQDRDDRTGKRGEPKPEESIAQRLRERIDIRKSQEAGRSNQESDNDEQKIVRIDDLHKTDQEQKDRRKGQKTGLFSQDSGKQEHGAEHDEKQAAPYT